jgi:hypothetical protein
MSDCNHHANKPYSKIDNKRRFFLPEVFLFGKWSSSEIDFDSIDESLVDYVSLNSKQQVVVPHNAARYQKSVSTK